MAVVPSTISISISLEEKKKKKEQTDGIQKALFSHQNNQKIHYYI